jgi:hypothetical protein
MGDHFDAALYTQGVSMFSKKKGNISVSILIRAKTRIKARRPSVRGIPFSIFI